jgi:hypothetical protein
MGGRRGPLVPGDAMVDEGLSSEESGQPPPSIRRLYITERTRVVKYITTIIPTVYGSS